jgi:pectinesterase
VKIEIFFLAFMIFSQNVFAQKIIVDQNGKGNFITIQDAINSLSDSSIKPRTIIIKNGIYKEKISIKKTNVILQGESKDATIITMAIARDEFRCDHTDDWGVATINVAANDVTLKNLTIINSYGNENIEKKITCALDSNKLKTIRKDGHQMALRTMSCTKLKAINCHFIAYGGDTVSPWEVESGMWYFKNCIMEGGVDFYCPRGWAWAEGCTFIAKSGTAAIWHDGSKYEDAKTVLKNCTFNGYDGFLLGRYHRDAQFYLVNCIFASNMRDSAIYQVPTTNKLQWGHRVYYYNCKKEEGKDFAWYANNLPKNINAKKIKVNWVFKDKWKP